MKKEENYKKSQTENWIPLEPNTALRNNIRNNAVGRKSDAQPGKANFKTAKTQSAITESSLVDEDNEDDY